MRRSWRSQRMLKIGYVVAIIGFDTAENEPSKATCLPFLILQKWSTEIMYQGLFDGLLSVSIEWHLFTAVPISSTLYLLPKMITNAKDSAGEISLMQTLDSWWSPFTIRDASRSRQKTKKNALNPTIAQRRSMHGCCRKQLGQPSKGCAFPTYVSATCWCTRNSALIQARVDRPRTVGLCTSTAEKETWRPETWKLFCVRAMSSNQRFDYVFLN